MPVETQDWKPASLLLDGQGNRWSGSLGFSIHGLFKQLRCEKSKESCYTESALSPTIVLLSRMSERPLSRPIAYRPTADSKSLRGKRCVGKPRAKRKRRLKLRQIVAAAVLGGGLAYLQFRPAPKTPEAILVLGGEPRREQFAAEFAKQHPGLPIWVSGGSNPEYAEWIFHEAGVSGQLVHLDYAAKDTLTNFTTIVDKLKSQHINSVYLITSDYHMRRSQWIGQVVLGSRGIQFQPIAIPTDKPSEPLEKAALDGLRAALWVATGDTSMSLKQEFR
jgi:uncharacterized SAM-binding protein YcdF (DUF218 family)